MGTNMLTIGAIFIGIKVGLILLTILMVHIVGNVKTKQASNKATSTNKKSRTEYARTFPHYVSANQNRQNQIHQNMMQQQIMDRFVEDQRTCMDNFSYDMQERNMEYASDFMDQMNVSADYDNNDAGCGFENDCSFMDTGFDPFF